MKFRLPTVYEETSDPSPHQAAWWRRTVMKITRADLAQRIGVTEEYVMAMELGVNRFGKPHSERTWKHYRMLCAGAMFEMKRGPFRWSIKDERTSRAVPGGEAEGLAGGRESIGPSATDLAFSDDVSRTEAGTGAPAES